MQKDALRIFHVKELLGERREVVLRARSRSDSVDLVARALGVARDDVVDADRFVIVEVNYGDDFLAGGPRGIIAIF